MCLSDRTARPELELGHWMNCVLRVPTKQRWGSRGVRVSVCVFLGLGLWAFGVKDFPSSSDLLPPPALLPSL